MAGKTSGLRDIIFKNKGLKMVAIVLAVVSWFGIRKAISHERLIRDVPLEIQVDEGWAILSRSVNGADVWFVGSQAAIASLSREHLKVEIDMRGQPIVGSTDIVLSPKNVRGPLGGVRVVQIAPQAVTLSLDQEGEAQVPVKVVFATDPPVGYAVEKVEAVPASVSIFGPRQRLSETDAVRTEPINLTGRVRSFELPVPLLEPSELWVARTDPESVMVHVTLTERSATTELKDVRVSAMINPELAPTVRLWPNKVRVVLSGRPELVDGVQREDIRAYVDCQGLDPSASYSLPVRLHAPAGITLQRAEPSVVDVEMGEF